MVLDADDEYAARPFPARATARAAVALLIPVGWFLAMGLSRHGHASLVMASAAALLCIAVYVTRSVDVALLIPNERTIVIGIVAAVVMVIATWAGFKVVALNFPALKNETAALYGHLRGTGSATLSILIVSLVVVAEEILWRGAFQSFLRAHIRNPVAVVILCSLAYGVALASFGSPLLVATGFACGLYWSSLRSWTGSIVPPLIAHLLWDMAIALMPLK